MMSPAEKKKTLDRHAALLRVEGRTPAEAATYVALAAKLRRDCPEAFSLEASTRPFSLDSRFSRSPSPRSPAGTLSYALSLGEGPFAAHRWVLALGLARELGCVVAEGHGGPFFFSTARDPVKRATESLTMYLLCSEADATQALGKISAATDSHRVRYYQQVWLRAYSNALLAERLRVTPRTKREEAARRVVLATAAVDKVPGWRVITTPPDDPWAPSKP